MAKKYTTSKQFASSYKLRRNEYNRYKTAYRKVNEKYGSNMTDMYSYKDFKEVRQADLDTARKLGERPSSMRTFAQQQVETSRDQASAVVNNYRKNLSEIRDKQNQGKSLTKTEQIILDSSYEEHVGKNGRTYRRRKYTTQEEYRAGKGAIVDTWETIKNDKSISAADRAKIIEELFGSP